MHGIYYCHMLKISALHIYALESYINMYEHIHEIVFFLSQVFQSRVLFASGFFHSEKKNTFNTFLELNLNILRGIDNITFNIQRYAMRIVFEEMSSWTHLTM